MHGGKNRHAPGHPQHPAPLWFQSRTEMDFSSCHLLLRAADRAQHARVRETPAQDARHSFLDFFFRGLGILVEKNFGGKNHATQAIAALRGFLIDERLLNRMRLVDGSQTFERDDLESLHRFHRSSAGANRLSLHHDGAGSALPEATPEFWPAQPGGMP